MSVTINTLFALDAPEPPALGVPLDPRGWYSLIKMDVGQGWALDFVNGDSQDTPSILEESMGDVSYWLSFSGAVISTAIYPSADQRLRRTTQAFLRRLSVWRQFNHGPVSERQLRLWLRECRLYPIERRPSAEES